MNKLPDLKLLCVNETEAKWATSKLYALLPDASTTTANLSAIYWLYYNANTNNFGYDTDSEYDLETGGVTDKGCYPERIVYKVSELMTPLQDGAYQIEDSAEGKKWLEFLLIKFVLQDVMSLTEYEQATRYLPKIRQLRKGNYNGSVDNTNGWDIREGFEYGLPKIYQHTDKVFDYSTSSHTVLSVTNLVDLFNQKYLVKIDSAYVEVYIVPNAKTPNGNTDLVRVVDLVGEKFYWVYRSDIYSNNTGDLK